MPEIDWNYPGGKQYQGSLADVELGVRRDTTGVHEWDHDTREFVRLLLKNGVFSEDSIHYISDLDWKEYVETKRNELRGHLDDIKLQVSEHYLCRLFLQLNVGAKSNSFIIVNEEDLRVLKEIGRFLETTKVAVPFEVPDLTGSLIEPEGFCEGLLNFSPRDIQSVAAVRSDLEVQKYGRVIRGLLKETASADRERKILEAMVEAHQRSEAGKRAEKLFEVMSWIAKPLHYVPGVDATLTALEDAKDLGMKWLNRAVVDREWHLVAVRMQEVAIKEYLARKSNLIRPIPPAPL